MVVRADQLAVTAAQEADLQRWLSPARLGSYMPAAPHAQGLRGALDHYVFNMRLAEAMLGPLHVLEVVVRNALHEQLARVHGRGDWWNAPGLVLVPHQTRSITEVVGRVADQCAKKGRGPSVDDVVAALDLGFWCGLLSRGDAQIDYERTLWQPALRHAFPHNRRTRQQVWRQFDELRRLRNRIGHHEPIYERDLAKDLQNVLLVLGYVSPHIAGWVDDRSLLPLLLKVNAGDPLVSHF